jgi:hypothetical protein
MVGRSSVQVVLTDEQVAELGLPPYGYHDR